MRKGDCTGNGHFEAFAAGSAANALARARFGEHADARRLVDAAEGGDQHDLRPGRARHRLGAGIGSLVNIFNPELPDHRRRLRRRRRAHLGPGAETLAVEGLPCRGRSCIVLAELGHEAGMVGAALVGFETLDAATYAQPSPGTRLLLARDHAAPDLTSSSPRLSSLDSSDAHSGLVCRRTQ